MDAEAPYNVAVPVLETKFKISDFVVLTNSIIMFWRSSASTKKSSRLTEQPLAANAKCFVEIAIGKPPDRHRHQSQESCGNCVVKRPQLLITLKHALK